MPPPESPCRRSRPASRYEFSRYPQLAFYDGFAGTGGFAASANGSREVRTASLEVRSVVHRGRARSPDPWTGTGGLARLHRTCEARFGRVIRARSLDARRGSRSGAGSALSSKRPLSFGRPGGPAERHASARLGTARAAVSLGDSGAIAGRLAVDRV